jgi:hypothetical protein
MQTVSRGNFKDTKGNPHDGVPAQYDLPTREAISLPILSFRPTPLGPGRKVFKEELDEVSINNKGHIPGYTGHMHAEQHMFGQSFGRVSRDLKSKPPTLDTSTHFLSWFDDRPQGEVLQGDGHRIPGYTGHIRSKENHIYSKTYGNATRLALGAVAVQKTGKLASGIPQLVEQRPTGNIDLYTQRIEDHIAETAGEKPSKHPAPADVVDYAKKSYLTYKEIAQVNKAKHCVPGYTGHIPGDQHVYGTTYGQTTGQKLTKGKIPDQSKYRKLVNYEEFRPNHNVPQA